ncbi:MAG: DUF2634 domain-containing protein [Oscillospiraceae bacterium]|jgi:hypothetical protein|nr:DUF2634 domain-containing protein [Oscillospiraceae bacterium]
MALLPEQINGLPIDTTIEYVDYPSLNWYADPLTHRLTRMCDGKEAMNQSIEIILAVERFKYSIFTANFGMEYDRLIGSEYGWAASELQRRLEDAFKPDNRIIGVSDFRFARPSPDGMLCEFTVNTVYGGIDERMEVSGIR